MHGVQNIPKRPRDARIISPQRKRVTRPKDRPRNRQHRAQQLHATCTANRRSKMRGSQAIALIATRRIASPRSSISIAFDMK